MLLAFCLLLSDTHAKPALAKKLSGVVPDEYIVRLAPRVDDNYSSHFAALERFDEIAILRKWNIDKFNAYHVKAREAAGLAFIRSRVGREVLYIEPNQFSEVADDFEEANSCAGAELHRSWSPNATSYERRCFEQQGAVWGITRTSQSLNLHDSKFRANRAASGQGVSVYMIGGGLRCTHSEFANGSNAYRCRTGAVFVDNPPVNGDSLSTHLASIVAGESYGIAKSAEIVSVVIRSDGTTKLDVLISAIAWASNDAKIKRSRGGKKSIAHISAIFAGRVRALNEVASAAVNAGLAMFTLSGNTNTDSCDFSPGSATSVFTVDASTFEDERWLQTESYGSNFGKCSNMAAPGQCIIAASNSNDWSIRPVSGTNRAAAHVVGVAASMLSARYYRSAYELYHELYTNSNTEAIVTNYPPGTRQNLVLLNIMLAGCALAIGAWGEELWLYKWDLVQLREAAG